MKIRNAVAAVFYIENSNAEDIERNRKELVVVLSAVLKKDGIKIVNRIKDRLLSLQNIPVKSKTIKSIEDITEVLSMYETRTKQWVESVFAKGIEQGDKQGFERGIEQGVEKNQLEIGEKMIQNGMSNTDIRKITGMSLAKIEQIRKKTKTH